MNKEPQDQPEQDPVWDLLGHASKHEADPMFARNVMRSIRLEADTPSLWQRLCAPRPMFAALTGVAACAIAAVIVVIQPDPRPESVSPITASTSDTEVIFDEIAQSYDAPKDMDEIIIPVSFTRTDDTQFIMTEALEDNNWDM